MLLDDLKRGICFKYAVYLMGFGLPDEEIKKQLLIELNAREDYYNQEQLEKCIEDIIPQARKYFNFTSGFRRV